MSSIPCNVVLLPSETIASKVIDLSHKLKSDKSLYTLDGVNCFAHLSLYMFQIKVADLELVKDLLASLASKFKSLDLIASRYDQAMGFIDIEYTRNQQLDDLASEVVKLVNPLRDGMRAKDRKRMGSATGLALSNYQKYGYKNVGELFRPHISLTRFSDENPIDTSPLPQIEQYSGLFNQLAIFEMGDNGTCVRKIGSYSLV